ncbi:cullin-1-like [Microplitis mediator]|uniref:cullin-1-like n=1 Tax=Microplitis mediator TaxID=375433 RepID=UPI0025573C37|nr:cullin-1-like [Microplitis mediator]
MVNVPIPCSKDKKKQRDEVNNELEEFAARYCNRFMKKYRKISKTKNPGTKKAQQVANLSKYFQHQIVFIEYYQAFFAKRYINEMLASDSDEALIISKIEKACGHGYTRKLQIMLKDVAESRNLNESFKSNLAKSCNIDIDFSFKIIQIQAWPLEQLSSLVILPCELERLVNKFTSFYLSEWPTKAGPRCLRWLYNLSIGEIQANCFSKSFNFRASTFQILVLMKFNTATSFTIRQLHDATQIDIDLLNQTIKTLLETGLLIISGEKEEAKLKLSTRVELNIGYNNPQQQVNIYTTMITENKERTLSIRYYSTGHLSIKY